MCLGVSDAKSVSLEALISAYLRSDDTRNVPCPQCDPTAAVSDHVAIVYLNPPQPTVLVINVNRGWIRRGKRVISATNVLYPARGLLVCPDWEPMDLVSSISFDRSHYTSHVVTSVRRDVGGLVDRVNHVTHDSRERKRKSAVGSCGPLGGQVTLLFYRKASLTRPIHALAKGLKWADNNCYLNSLLHALVYLVAPVGVQCPEWCVILYFLCCYFVR